TKTQQNMKKWLALLISDDTSKWLEIGAPIEKKDLNINKSILRITKAACLGCIIDKTRINLGRTMAQEMVIRAKQRQTSLPFLVLITEIKVEYLKYEAERKKASLVDSSPIVDTDTLPVKVPFPTPAGFQPQLTQAALLQMRKLAHSADRRAAKLKASISDMIQTSLTDVELTALKAAIAALKRDVD
ncbi:hypothetical protein H5410_060888, partial [Solanum commersonii]